MYRFIVIQQEVYGRLSRLIPVIYVDIYNGNLSKIACCIYRWLKRHTQSTKAKVSVREIATRSEQQKRNSIATKIVTAR